MKKNIFYLLITILVLLSCNLPGNTAEEDEIVEQPTPAVPTEGIQQPPPTEENVNATIQPGGDPAPESTPTATDTPTEKPAPTTAPYRPQLLVDNSNWVFYILNTDGSGTSAVIQGFGATWSPDGNKIAYISIDDDLYISEADGANAINLTNGALGCRFLAWFPDGTKIVFSAFIEGEPLDLYVINADGSGLTNLTNTPAVGENNPALSPDAGKIAFTAESPTKVYVINIDGSDSHLLADGFRPSWSPDGTRIAYVYSTSESVSDIYLINPDGSGKHNLLENSPIVAGGFMPPVWSSDGSKILFSTEPLIKISDLYVINADGSGLANLTNTPEISEFNPIWSPDGTQIAFEANPQYSGDYDIFLMQADGSGQVNLMNGAIKDLSSFLSWRPFP